MRNTRNRPGGTGIKNTRNQKTMKAINKKADKFYHACINAIPRGGTAFKLDTSKTYMPLCVERIGGNRFGLFYSFAHYGEQNGDLMRDPDVVMLSAMGRLYPVSFRNDYLGINGEYVEFDESNRVKIYKRKQADLASFCGIWAQNIMEQQGVARVEGSRPLDYRLIFKHGTFSAPAPAAALTDGVLCCSPTVADWLDPDGGLRAAGLMTVK